MLSYTIKGEGKTLVFLHGFLETSTMWYFLPLSELGAKTIFIDLPGHGKSGLEDHATEPSIDFMADEVATILTKENVSSYSIVGHSMGGYVALRLKEMHAHCEKVVLLNSNFWDDNEQKKKDRLRVADIAFKAKQIFINEAIPNLFGNTAPFETIISALKNEASQMLPEAIAYAALAMRVRKDYTKMVHENPTDYFVIHGNLDRLVDVETMQNKFPFATNRFFIENAGHMAHIEASAEVMRLLKAIL